MVALSQTPFHPSPTLDRRAPELSVHLLSVVFKAIRRPAGFVSKDAQRGHGEYEASKMVSFIKNHEKCIKMVVFHRLAMKNGALDLLSCCSRFYHWVCHEWVNNWETLYIYFYASFSSKEVEMVVFSTGNVVLALEIWWTIKVKWVSRTTQYKMDPVSFSKAVAWDRGTVTATAIVPFVLKKMIPISWSFHSISGPVTFGSSYDWWCSRSHFGIENYEAPDSPQHQATR